MSTSKIDCISYIPSTLELFIPSQVIFSTLCLSTDKTNLFIVSLVRLLVYIIIYYVTNDIINLENHLTIQYLLFALICVNILYIGIVVTKITVFSVSSERSMFEKTEAEKKLQYDIVTV
jgi:hypothetical protein